MSLVRFRLRALREKAGMTQEQLAIKARIRQATLSNLETGKSTRITFAALGRLAKILAADPGDFFEWVRGEPRE